MVVGVFSWLLEAGWETGGDSSLTRFPETCSGVSSVVAFTCSVISVVHMFVEAS